MPSVLHLRGGCGSGKSTAVRELIDRLHQQLKIVTVETRYGSVECESYGDVVIVGRYLDKQCACGCDILTDKLEVIDCLKKLMELGFSSIVFEGLIYGTTYKLGMVINSMCSRMGYKYVPIMIERDIEESLSYVFERNGGKPINTKARINDFVRVRTSYEKLIRSGIEGARIEATGKERGFLGEQLESIIAEKSK